MTALLMDLGGTRLKAGVTAADGSIERRHVADVSADDRDSLLKLISATGWNLLSGHQPEAVGLCVPGLVDAGTLVALPGKLAGLVGGDLSAFLRREFDVERVIVSHDGVAYATGEAAAGAGAGVARSVVVTIGTGVGVAVMVGGRPVTTGMFGGGILGGFIPIADPGEGRTDSTGQTDTIEALCASSAIVDLAGPAYSGVPEVYDAYERGDPGARAAIDRYRERLARALVALAHAHAPDRIILGGGAMKEGNPVVGGLAEIVNGRLFGTYRVEVVRAALGDDAGLLGLLHLLRGDS